MNFTIPLAKNESRANFVLPVTCEGASFTLQPPANCRSRPQWPS